MNSIYGNIISHLPRSGFSFVKVFSNRSELENYDWENQGTELGVGAYVLVDYMSSIDIEKTVDGEMSMDIAAANELYEINKQIDAPYINEDLNNADYHRTVWQVRKDEIQNQIVCSFQLITKINSTLIGNFIPVGSYFTIEDMDYQDYATFGSMQLAWPDEESDIDWTTTVIDLTFKNQITGENVS